MSLSRRTALKRLVQGATAAASTQFPQSIERALALPALGKRRDLGDIQHVVLLMLENRAFDHYFGTLRGVRGFRDRQTIPMSEGRSVWEQSDGLSIVQPFRLDSRTTSALKAPSTTHSFGDAQAAWNQGRFGYWPKFKTPLSMGHYHRDDIPFQFALADAFTICDAYHASITTGTDPNRIVFWSGSNSNPSLRQIGKNCTDRDSEPDNFRCWIEGALPEPGYKYQGSSFHWPTIPEVLEGAGVSWRIYQDPNDNWTGAMHGCLAFETFRNAKPGSPIYENGMRHWSLERLAEDVRDDTLPQVSWILPSQTWSEHPNGSSPVEGADFTGRVLDALTSNPKVWGRSVVFVTFDENDGYFDHVPPPAPPSFNSDRSYAGKSTLDLAGEYFEDVERKYLLKDDPSPGSVRPWGLGARVPMYVVSPWSSGGWVNSQVFDQTSVGRFLERRFGVNVPAINRWNRAVSGDLTTCLDFNGLTKRGFPALPRIKNLSNLISQIEGKPAPQPPTRAEVLYQESGIRRSRALPYALEVDAVTIVGQSALQLRFRNEGTMGAVFHVYDRLHLDLIPRRYTVEAGKSLEDRWAVELNSGQYDLWVYGPNGFVREFVGRTLKDDGDLEVAAVADLPERALRLTIDNRGSKAGHLLLRDNAYGVVPDWRTSMPARSQLHRVVLLSKKHNWYDFVLEAQDWKRRFAGRLETGRHDISDPAV